MNTRFNLASAGKMFTGVAVMQLVEQGKLGLDSPVGRYLPDYRNRAVADHVTIAQLLTHTSGLGSYFNPMYGERRALLRKPADYLPLFVNEPLAFAPGSRYDYSNAGYLVLGLIVERVTGQSYYDYVRDHIFRPAGMTHTGYYDPDQPDSAIAVGYTTEGPEGERPGPPMPNDDQREIRGGPAGGGYSTAGDLLRFARALWANALLKPASTVVATTGKVSMGRAGVMYAYGFGIEQRDGLRSVGHEGGFPGVSSSIAMYPDLGYTVVVLANEDPPASSVIANRARALLSAS